uniref:RNA helicase n=1 Tax=Astatotilapia calliptera TaxID=8154 RepID=A0AAX7VGM5_ASTCA
MSKIGAATQKPSMTHNAPQHGSSVSNFKEIHIDEEVKIAVTLCHIHYVSQNEKGPNRFVTIRKKNETDNPQPTIPMTLSQNTFYFIRSLLQRFPVSKKERIDIQPNEKTCLCCVLSDNSYDKNRASGRLNNGIPMVPRRRSPSELDSFRCSLPVHEHQEEIIQIIKKNRVVLVLGETGSGKTTQIPQFLLDDCSKKGESCRIFCTQPRRLAAIAVADRVAAERGEGVGQTVGYHIRLESRVSPKTLLTFCTSGVLLRTLMTGDASLTTVTHVIVDEVHERDGLTDFLLTKMRDVLQKIPTIKLILSSAALDIDLFRQYFGSCPVIHLKGRHFEVKEFFLEDILRLTGFTRKDMRKYKEETEKKQKYLTEWCQAVQTSSVGQKQSTHATVMLYIVLLQNEKDTEQMEPWLRREMDSCISSIFLNEDQDSFIQLFNLILSESVNVDYMHSETGTTPLMAAAGRGFITQLEQLLSLGADINIKASNGWTALDFAEHFQQTDTVDLLKSSIPLGEVSNLNESALVQCDPEMSLEDQELLRLYHHSFDDQWVDLELIMNLLHNICSNTSDGAILIFLPGYDEIVELRDRILHDDKRFSGQSERYHVFTLHSDMQTQDQKKALKTSPPGVRKIILSTNIAETSITINDVVFVIDSGKVKEQDALFHLLKFHIRLFIPIILNTRSCCVCKELCLQTKLLAPSSCPVAEFLAKAPQPPPTHAVRNAVQMLKKIDAMNQFEDLTDLGYHLADLPVEPNLGKMVLCAVVLKCLDPILTIACTLAYRDPFILPTQSSQKRAALSCRKRFTSNTFSDHMALLRAFQAWQKARSEGWERAFCEKNFLSQATMDMILGMRTQLLGQLRAIGFVRARGGCDIRDVNLNSENWAMVKAALVAGMYPNMVNFNKESSLKKLHFHPTSVLSQFQFKEKNQTRMAQALPTDWMIYDEMSRGHRMVTVRCCTLVTSITVAIFGGCSRLHSSALHEPAVQKTNGKQVIILHSSACDSETEDLSEIRIDDWLGFEMDREAAGLLSELRQKWQSLFIKRIRCPSKPWSQQDEAVIQTLVSVLGAEEQAAGLQQPTGIGQRPRPMPLEEGTRTSVKNPKNTPRLPTTSTTNERLEFNTTASPAATSIMKLLNDQLIGFSTLVRYFIMKSSNIRNLEISQQKGIWSTTPSNETKLTKAFLENSAIILIFSVQGSGHFQGYARMTSVVSQEESCHDWGLMELGGAFSVEWIHKENIPFQCTQHILNPWNDNKKVQISRDGQVHIQGASQHRIPFLSNRGS